MTIVTRPGDGPGDGVECAVTHRLASMKIPTWVHVGPRAELIPGWETERWTTNVFPFYGKKDQVRICYDGGVFSASTWICFFGPIAPINEEIILSSK